MTADPGAAPLFDTEAMRDADAQSGFRSGKHSLDDYLARHALANHQRGIGVTYVLRRRADDPGEWPDLLGY